MRKAEIGYLLAVCASFDHRTVGEADIEAWHHVLGHLDFIPCRQAIYMHYGRTADFIAPAHIIDEVKGRKLTPTPIDSGLPDADPDDVPAWLAAKREGRVVELPPGEGLDWERLRELKRLADSKAIDPEEDTA